VNIANSHPDRKATVDQQTVGRTRRIRKAQARKTQLGRPGETSTTDVATDIEASASE
jgi:hypothetical protein